MNRDHMMGFPPAAKVAADAHDDKSLTLSQQDEWRGSYPLGVPTHVSEANYARYRARSEQAKKPFFRIDQRNMTCADIAGTKHKRDAAMTAAQATGRAIVSTRGYEGGSKVQAPAIAGVLAPLADALAAGGAINAGMFGAPQPQLRGAFVPNISGNFVISKAGLQAIAAKAGGVLPADLVAIP